MYICEALTPTQELEANAKAKLANLFMNKPVTSTMESDKASNYPAHASQMVTATTTTTTMTTTMKKTTAAVPTDWLPSSSPFRPSGRTTVSSSSKPRPLPKQVKEANQRLIFEYDSDSSDDELNFVSRKLGGGGGGAKRKGEVVDGAHTNLLAWPAAKNKEGDEGQFEEEVMQLVAPYSSSPKEKVS